MEARKDHQLGILFVHGIGEQPEGETLLAFGEPVIEWLNGWLRRDPRFPGGVEVVEAVLTPSKLSQSTPPHATLRVEPAHQSWLVAESWWGGDVKAPAFGKLAYWMVTVGAWSVLSHVTKGLLRQKNGFVRFAAQVWAFLKWLVWSGLLQLIVVVLAAFALLPVPALRRSLSGVLIALTGVLGDSYVLLESDLQRSAIVNKARAALDWICSRCDQVIVVAHSQGAAIAYYALRDPFPENVHTLLTFGSGLNKLEELQRLRKAPARIAGVARLCPVVLLLFALVIRVVFYEEWGGLAQIAVFFLGALILFAALLVMISALEHWRQVEGWAQSLRFVTSRQGMAWIDIHASHDAVPNGVLSPLGTRVAWEERRVVNLRSVFGDHTAYWRNRAQFVPIVVRAIGSAAGIHLFSSDEQAALSRAEREHARAVGWLYAIRVATLMSPFLLPVLWWKDLHAPGAAISSALHAVGGLFDRIPGMLQALIAWASPPNTTEAQAADATLRTLAALAFAVLILVWHKGYQLLWRWWDGRSLERVYRPSYLAHPVDRGIVNVAAIAAGLVPLVLVIGWPVLRRVVVGDLVAGAVLVVYSGFLISILARVLAATVKVWPQLRTWDRKAWKEVGGQFMTLGFFAMLVAGFILPEMFPRFAPLTDWTLFGMMAAAFAFLFVWLQQTVTASAGRVVTRRVTRIAVLILPVLAVAALAVVVWVELRDDSSPDSPAGLLGRLALASFFSYMLALGALALGLRLIERRRAKQPQASSGPS